MDHSTLNCAPGPCPCGDGKVIIDIVPSENGWMIESDWVGRIECEACRDRFCFIQFGRGVALIRSQDAERRKAALKAANERTNAFLACAEASAVLDQIADQLAECPSIAGSYRLAVALGLESATVQTFSKHVRNMPMRQWLGYHFSTLHGRSVEHLNRLMAIYRHERVDSGNLQSCIDDVSSYVSQTSKLPDIVASFGPINLLAAMSRSREIETS